MRCSKCSSDNREGRKFCANCGTQLAVTCAKCGASNQPGEKFCGECGAEIGTSTPLALSSAKQTPVQLSDAIPATEVIDGERKMVTALFADIKGSMELMEDLDPEEARAIVDPALKLMIDAVHHYGGYIVQSTGDGIFALFGAPVAHEDHPQRALYAALRMQDDMRRYGDRMRTHGHTPLQVRVGVNTGEVVVRSLQTGPDHTEYTPMGHSTGLAARLQTLATPGTTMISEFTRRLVEGFFQLKSCGPTRLKGVTEHIDVYEVTGLGPLRTRLQRAAARGLTKFVGRQREMDALKHAAQQAQTGHGQVVAVMADPGVGKSRLFYEFKAASQSGWMVLEAFSVSYGKASAYLPVLELLSQYFETTRDDDDRKRRERVLGKVLGLDRTLEDTLPYLNSLLAVAETDDSLVQMDPQIRRRRTGDAIKRILLRESLSQPLMLIFEDLHWIDSETQVLLNVLVDAIASARILLLVNYRPEYRHEWGSRTHYTQVRLDPLGPESAEQMLDALLASPAPAGLPERADGERPAPHIHVGGPVRVDDELAALKRLIIQRTQGTPFFMEEMVQALFEEGVLHRNGTVTLARPINAIRIPATVRAVLASRIDRLPSLEKELLQTLAVLGREFTLKLVQHVALRSSDELEQMLIQLQLGEFIYEQPAVGELEYSFKHALTQEVAYNSLLNERRRGLHDRAAAAIEALYKHQLDEHYGELAHHCLRGNDAAKAIHYARSAAEQAVGRGLYGEATRLIESAVGLLDQLPKVNERLRGEMALRTIEGMIAFALYGGASKERERVVKRMCELGENIGGSEQLPSLIALGNLYFQRGEPLQGLELTDRCVRLATGTQGPDLLGEAYLTQGLLAASCGKLREAVSCYERSLRTSRGDRPSSVGVLYEVLIPTALSNALHLIGRIGAALRLIEQVLRQARQSNHLHDLSFVLTLTAEMPRYYRREPEIALAHSQEAIAISEENGFTYWLHRGRFVHGWASAELGQHAEGISEMERGIAGFRQIGGAPFRHFAQTRLARAYASVGQLEKGLSLIDAALERIETTGEKMTQAEMLRLKGEVLLMRDPAVTAQAESCLRASLEVARAQEAKWWELRSSVSLARLLRDTNRRDEAHVILSEAYNWFTEGFELLDLKEAKALLDELAG